MRALVRSLGPLLVGAACLATPVRDLGAQEAKPATPTNMLERRLADPSVKGAMQQVGSAMIASGRDSTRELARTALGDWFWAFHSDVRLEPDVREAAEIDFDESFDAIATATKDRKIDSLMVVGIDDIATGRCMRWHFLSIGPQGPVLFSAVVYQANDKPRLRDLRVLTALEEVEAAVDAIEHHTGDQVFTVQVPLPKEEAAPASQKDAGTGEASTEN